MPTYKKMYWSKHRIENYIKSQIQQSIKNDVGVSLNAYWKEYSKNKNSVGFFAVPRMIFPEIDGLGSYITGNPRSTTLNIKTYLQKVMSLVDPRYYDLALFIAVIFRHGLLHQHSPKQFKRKKAGIGWRFVISDLNDSTKVSRRKHLVFIRNELNIYMNLFFDDVIKSIDLFLPMVTNEYKNNFEKSIRLQNKKLTINYCIKKRIEAKRNDFLFLK